LTLSRSLWQGFGRGSNPHCWVKFTRNGNRCRFILIFAFIGILIQTAMFRSFVVILVGFDGLLTVCTVSYCRTVLSFCSDSLVLMVRFASRSVMPAIHRDVVATVPL